MFNPNATPFGATLPTLATAQHSQIRQEADYIRERIISASFLCRKLTAEITKAENRLGMAREDDCSEEPVASLKKFVRKQRSRLNRCRRNQHLLEEQLEAILAEIQRLELRQWRRSALRPHSPQIMYTGQIANPAYEPAWSMNPHPLTPALCPPPMLPVHMQDPYHPVVGYLPRAPLLRPVQVPWRAYTQSTRQMEPEFGDVMISPPDAMSPYDLNLPGGFPEAQHDDLADAVANMQISQAAPSPTQLHETDVFLHQSMPDHQSAALRLQRAAEKKKH